MNYLPNSKWGDCTQCPAKDVACVKKGKVLICTTCNDRNKAIEQADRAKKRTANRNTQFKLRNTEIPGRATEEYGMAEVQALKNDLDFIFSRLVRMTTADEFGNCACYTCGAVKHWSLMQCGHFIKRANTQTRWDLRNARVQDKYCNENLDGNMEVFENNLEAEYPGLVSQLREISQKVHKWSRDELKQLLIDLRSKLKIVEAKFNHQTNIQ